MSQKNLDEALASAESVLQAARSESDRGPWRRLALRPRPHRARAERLIAHAAAWARWLWTLPKIRALEKIRALGASGSWDEVREAARRADRDGDVDAIRALLLGARDAGRADAQRSIVFSWAHDLAIRLEDEHWVDRIVAAQRSGDFAGARAMFMAVPARRRPRAMAAAWLGASLGGHEEESASILADLLPRALETPSFADHLLWPACLEAGFGMEAPLRELMAAAAGRALRDGQGRDALMICAALGVHSAIGWLSPLMEPGTLDHKGLGALDWGSSERRLFAAPNFDPRGPHPILASALEAQALSIEIGDVALKPIGDDSSQRAPRRI